MDTPVTQGRRLRVAVYKFTSCDGCQLAFLNMGDGLLELFELVDMVHFAEAGIVDPEAAADVAFVEGSISTPDQERHIRRIRDNTRHLITIGACATAGGVQALRNRVDAGPWFAAVYAQPQYIDSLATSTPVASHVHVDFELWGCPVNSRQVTATLRALMSGAAPWDEGDKVCMECKRHLAVCVLVAKGIPCLGPVTRTGCGALCPRFGRDCYGCYGPSETPNTDALARRYEGLGLAPETIARRFASINNEAPEFRDAALKARGAAPLSPLPKGRGDP